MRTGNLRNKLEALGASNASPRQTLNITRTAIIPTGSFTYALAVTPCIPADLIIWDNMISRTQKEQSSTNSILVWWRDKRLQWQ